MQALFLVHGILNYAFMTCSISVRTSPHFLIFKFVGYAVLVGSCFSSLTQYICKNDCSFLTKLLLNLQKFMNCD